MNAQNIVNARTLRTELPLFPSYQRDMAVKRNNQLRLFSGSCSTCSTAQSAHAFESRDQWVLMVCVCESLSLLACWTWTSIETLHT